MRDERTQAALLLVIGAMALRLGVTDAGLAYLKPVMQPFLAVAGAVVVAFGAGQLVRVVRGGRSGGEREADHHAHGMGAAWLLVAPVLALLLIAPPPLGAFAAERQGDAPLGDDGVELDALPAPSGGAVELTLREYTARALYDAERSLEGERVRLVGFVVPVEGDEAAYRLTRFVITCCAADATAVGVDVTGDAPRPADQWVEVEGTWRPAAGHEPGEPTRDAPVVEADVVREVEQPAEPYEY